MTDRRVLSDNRIIPCPASYPSFKVRWKDIPWDLLGIGPLPHTVDNECVACRLIRETPEALAECQRKYRV